MIKPPPDAPRVRLDHDILASCRAEDDLESWSRKLTNSGVLRTSEPGEGIAEGALVEVHRRYRTLERSATSAPDDSDLKVKVAAGLAWLVLGGLLLPTVLGWPGLILFLLVTGGGAWWLKRPDPRPDRRRARVGQELHQAVQRLLQHTFVDVIEGTIVESTPHRTFLVARLGDIDRARDRVEARVRELHHLRNRLMDANRELGRVEEDDEVAAVDREQLKLGEQLRELGLLREEVVSRLAVFDEGVERLRKTARRRVLSEKVGELLEDGVSEQAGITAATLEVDVLGLEEQFRRLELELSEADAQLRAVLEVAAVSRGSRR